MFGRTCRAPMPIAALFLALSLGSGFWLAASSQAQEPFYKGKTVRLLIGTTAGGGYDLSARLVGHYMGKYVPGRPDIIPQNMPGAGSLVAANYVYGIAKPDGLTLGAVNPALYFEQLIGRKEVQFDWAKFAWVGSPEQNDILFYIRSDSPYRSVDDFRKAKEPPKCGSSGTTTTGHYIPRLLEETLGVKTKIVSGYPGAPEIEVAILRNEVACWAPLTATYFGREPYWAWHKEGFVRVLLQTGRKRDPRLPAVPTIYELMQQYKTPESGRRLAQVIVTAPVLGRPIIAPPATPPDRVKVLREAFAKAMSDPELLAEAKRRGLQVNPLDGEELTSLTKELMVQPPEVIERMKWVLGR
ncbi:MAG: hypothetical protein HYV04_11950 [Deltaproteobacteria bacterium]|nr:hypothetical protein [Deltaproteobacteria bacterium]